MNNQQQTWELLVEVTGEMQANLIKGLLESGGIPVCLQREAIGSLYGLTTGPLAQIKVLVPGEEQPKAAELLRLLGEEGLKDDI